MPCSAVPGFPSLAGARLAGLAALWRPYKVRAMAAVGCGADSGGLRAGIGDRCEAGAQRFCDPKDCDPKDFAQRLCDFYRGFMGLHGKVQASWS